MTTTPTACADRLIGLREAGEILGISKWTVRERVRAGVLPGYRTGPGSTIKVRESDVVALLTPVAPAPRRRG